MAELDLSFLARLWLAFVTLFRVLSSPGFARRVASLPASAVDTGSGEPLPVVESPVSPSPDTASALGLLALFQREGRLVDFLEQDIAAFPDAEIGAAARVVHDGCRRALLAHADVVRVRTEAEGSAVTLDEGFDAASIKLTGDVRGRAPYKGTLRHSGWKIRQLRLPIPVPGYDPSIVAPAEVEL